MCIPEWRWMLIHHCYGILLYYPVFSESVVWVTRCFLCGSWWNLQGQWDLEKLLTSLANLDILGQVETRHRYTDRHDISWYALIQFTVMKDLFLCQAFFGGNNPFGVFGFDDDDMGGMGGAWTHRCGVVLSKHVKQGRIYHKYIQISNDCWMIPYHMQIEII